MAPAAAPATDASKANSMTPDKGSNMSNDAATQKTKDQGAAKP